MIELRTIFSLLLVLLLAGCGTGNNDIAIVNSSSIQSSPISEGAAVEGFLVRVNPILLVDDLNQAPPGATPLVGALVTARDVDDNAVGMALTGPTGYFRVEGTPGGLIQLEVRSAPGGPVDFRQSVTMVPGTVLHPGQTYPISREQAVEIARSRFGADTLVTGSLSPLPVGTKVVPADGSLAPRVSTAAEWFLMVNPDPYLMYAHNVEYIFVNAQSGELSSVAARYYPLVNGEPMWDALKDAMDYGTEIPAPPGLASPRAETVTFPATLARMNSTPAFDAPRLQGGENDGLFLLAASGSDDLPFLAGASRMSQRFLASGVPPQNVVPWTAATTKNSRATQELKLQDLTEGLLRLENMMAQRAAQNLPSTWVWYATGNASGTRVEMGSQMFTVDDFVGTRVRSGADKVIGIWDVPDLGDVWLAPLKSKADLSSIKPSFQFVATTAPTLSASVAFDIERRTVFGPVAPGAEDLEIGDGGVATTVMLDQMVIAASDVTGIVSPSGDSVLPPLADVRQFKSDNPVTAGEPQKPQAVTVQPTGELVEKQIITLPEGKVKTVLVNKTKEPIGLNVQVTRGEDIQVTLVEGPANGTADTTTKVPVEMELKGIRVGGVTVPFVDVKMDRSSGRALLEIIIKDDGRGGVIIMIPPMKCDDEEDPIELGDGERIL
jgi:hypothetical protein